MWSIISRRNNSARKSQDYRDWCCRACVCCGEQRSEESAIVGTNIYHADVALCSQCPYAAIVSGFWKLCATRSGCLIFHFSSPFQPPPGTGTVLMHLNGGKRREQPIMQNAFFCAVMKRGIKDDISSLSLIRIDEILFSDLKRHLHISITFPL